jgi:arabidopsis histidine kinase 2/3/4 (cytokinin receptor)
VHLLLIFLIYSWARLIACPIVHNLSRYRNKPHVPWSAISTPSGVFVICMLVGYIAGAAWSRYDNVKEDCRKMEELKKQAEAADVAKSQV